MLPSALSAFDIAALTAVLGMPACRLAVLPHAAGGSLALRLQRTTGAVLALLTLASFGILVARTLELNGGAWATLWADMHVVLHVTHFGHVWLWRLPALAVAWFAWRRAARTDRRWPIWLLWFAIAVVALTRSATGHPADHGDLTLAVWIDWLHILAAGAWVGTLFAMSLAVFPQLLATRDDTDGARLFQRLSTLSGWALGALLAAGIYNAYAQLGSVASLWTSRYGMVLDIKLAIVAAMIAIGAHNRYVKLPRLLAAAGQPVTQSWLARWMTRHAPSAPSLPDHTEVLRTCARAVLLESLLGLLVLGATGVLLHQMPPADMPRTMQAMPPHAMAHQGRTVAPDTAR